MKKHLLLSVLLALLSMHLGAQPNKKVAPALQGFLNTEFMTKFRDLRIGAESTAISVQANASTIMPSDMARLRGGYDQTAIRANQFLENIKMDFLNSKKMKSIADFPDMYGDGLRYKLQDIADFYAANFQQPLADATVGQDNVDGSAVLLLVVEAIGLTKGLIGYFNNIKREARQYTDDYLVEHLVKPYRWRYWDELSGNVSPYQKFEKNDNSMYQNSNQADQEFDQYIQKLNQAIQNLPKKDNDGGGSQEDTSGGDDWDWSPDDTPQDNTPPAENPTPPQTDKPAEKVKAAPAAKKKDNQ